MTHIPKLIGAALRATAAVAASLALIAGSPQGALAHQVVTAGDASSAVMVGIGLGSLEIPAQLPGSADRPMLTRVGGSGGTRPATRGGTKAGTNAATNEGPNAGNGVAQAQAHAATQAKEHAAAQSAVMGEQEATAGAATAATADTATAPTVATTTGTVNN